MTSYLKNSLRLGILFFGISLLWNCENIDGPIVEKTGEDQATAQSHNIKSIGNLNSLRPIIETIKAIRPTDTYSAKGTGSKNELDNINVDRIIQYTDETGFSTYTFKIENGLESINFENLHLVETENGYIGYILSYEPDVDWYNGILEDIGYFYFDISTFQGHITKYSLEREVIWSTNNGPTTKSSKSTTTAKRGGSGNFVQVCITTSPEPCLEGRHNDSVGWDDCAYSDGHWREACESVWVSGGLHPQDNPDYEGDGGGGSTTNGGTCTNTSGTSIVNSQPISGISTGCAPNNTVGFDIAAAYTAFWMDLVFAQQNYLNLYPDIKTSVLKYLYDSKYAPQAQKIANDLINKTNMSLIKNGLFVEAIAIFNFLSLNDWSYEAQNFTKAAIDALVVGQKFDFTESFRSPFNVDLSGVKPDVNPNTNELDKEVFMHVYNKLIQTPEFKRLFIDVFGQESRFTVKFKIEDNLECGGAEDPNGCTSASVKSVNGKPTSIVNNLITITLDKNYLETGSFISIARTIIHEAIHANIELLNIKDKSLALPLVYSHSIDTFASILQNRFNNDEHLFMANYYRPTMSKILKSIMPLLYSQERIQIILDGVIIDQTHSGLGEIENFNFNHFYEYYPWAGLQKTSEFKANFIIPKEYALYVGYYNYAKNFGHMLP